MDETNKVFLKECNVCETNRYDALTPEVWPLLHEPQEVFLDCRDDEDKEKVCIKINVNIGGKDEKRKIGVLSKEDSESIIKYVKMKWQSTLYNAVISRFDDKADENKRLSVVIYIVKNPQADQNPQK